MDKGFFPNQEEFLILKKGLIINKERKPEEGRKVVKKGKEIIPLIMGFPK